MPPAGLSTASRADCSLDEADAPIPTPVRGLQFDQAVPRQLVHRAAIAEVFVTDCVPTGPQRLRLAAQWPRGHYYFRPPGQPAYDPALFLETVRQAAAYASHMACGMPATHNFMLDEICFDVNRDALAVGNAPAHIELDLEYTLRGKGRSADLSFLVECTRDGAWLGTALVSGRAIAHEVYQRLRKTALPWSDEHDPAERVCPSLVGWQHPQDVLLSPAADEDTWELHSERSHPTHYDHPVDHIPGMVLVEASRQAARLLLDSPTATVVGARVSFTRFVEFGAPCTVSAEVAGPAADGATFVRVRHEQDGALAAECMIRMAAA